jgi:NAD(P)-dependent dehydrogenase (short-subunit alcohol dehydrogenase family)
MVASGPLARLGRESLDVEVPSMRVLVTGAASGIGRATVLRLARDAQIQGRSAQIAAVDLPQSQDLAKVAAELKALGGEALSLHGDMGDPQVPERMVNAAVEHFGGLDALVSNAGINRPGRLVGYAVDDWDRVFAVNTRATWLLAQAAYAPLKASGGAIVAVASMSGSEAHANLGPYGPSKAALIMLVKVLAQEFGPDGIRANTVSPGMVRTGMTAAVYADERLAAERAALVPLGRVATPEDMADVIAFLLGPDARYITGHDLIVDGGVTGNVLGRLPGLTRITRS